MLSDIEMASLNKELSVKAPEDIIKWAIAQEKNIMVSTSFGPFSAVMLHMASSISPAIPVLWVDTGYNTRETYLYAEKLIAELKLNIKVFIPEITAARRSALMDGIPDIHNEHHEQFTQQVKLEPFQRAIKKLNPDIWLTGIRKDETEFRKTLDVLSRGPNGILKIAPFLNWTEIDMEGYLYEHDLPQVKKYRDPTKAEKDRECGLHTMDYSI